MRLALGTVLCLGSIGSRVRWFQDGCVFVCLFPGVGFGFAVLGFRVACVQASVVCSYRATRDEEGNLRACAVFARYHTVAGAMQ